MDKARINVGVLREAHKVAVKAAGLANPPESVQDFIGKSAIERGNRIIKSFLKKPFHGIRDNETPAKKQSRSLNKLSSKT